MFDTSSATTDAHEQHTIQEYFDSHAVGLRHAALLLGGKPGGELVDSITASLASSTHLRPETMSRIKLLRDLLALEHVHIPGSLEQALFAGIHPSDPVVEEICLLTDGLRSALDAEADTGSSTPARAA